MFNTIDLFIHKSQRNILVPNLDLCGTPDDTSNRTEEIAPFHLMYWVLLQIADITTVPDFSLQQVMGDYIAKIKVHIVSICKTPLQNVLTYFLPLVMYLIKEQDLLFNHVSLCHFHIIWYIYLDVRVI